MATFRLTSRRLAAAGEETELGFRVHSGSQFSTEAKPALNPSYGHLRASLLAEGRLAPEGDHLVLRGDLDCANSSVAASLIYGYPVTGQNAWRGPKGEKPAKSQRFGLKKFSTRRKSLARSILQLVSSFDGLSSSDARAWRICLTRLAEDLAEGRPPPVHRPCTRA